MNLRRLRRLFARISASASASRTKGVLALANAGDTQSHAQELVADKLAQLPKHSRPTSAVFWHRQSHARAFDAAGELTSTLVLHWIGARECVAAALTEALASETDVTLVLAKHDEVAFAIKPKSVAKREKAAPASASAKAKKAKTSAKAAAPKTARTGAIDASALQVSKLDDGPESQALLLRALREGDGLAALAALVVLMRFALQRDEREATKRRKAGTEAAYYAELADRPGLFSANALDALAGNVRAACEALEEKSELALRLALRQAQKVAHPELPRMLDAAQVAAPWRARRLLAELGELPGATRALLHARISALVGDESVDVVSAACRSLGALEGTSEAAVMVNVLLRDVAAPKVRDWIFWTLAHSTLSPAERAKARPLAARPVFAEHEHRERFSKATR